MTSRSYRDLPLGAWLEAVAAREPAPGGGAAAATTAALGAGLVAMAARFSADEETNGIAARADVLRERALTLADDDARAYHAVLEAYRLPRDTEGRRTRIEEALARACEVPLAIAEGAAEIAALGADIGARGNPNLTGDAVTAVHLAVAAARSATELVLINARQAGLGPEPAERAQALVDDAEKAAQRLIVAGRPR